MIEFIRQLWTFSKENKKWSILPLFVMLGLLGIVLIFAQSSAVAPFIYALF